MSHATIDRQDSIAAIDRAAIDDFLGSAAHLLDDGEFERWPALFTEDGLYEITTRENLSAGYPIGLMRCVGRGMMLDRVEALRSANIYEAHVHTHLLGPALATARPGAIDVRSNFTVYRTMQGGSSEVFACGKYLDTLVLADGALRLARRTVVLDSRRIDTLLVFPL